MVLRAHDVGAMLVDPRTAQIEGADFVAFNRMPYGPAAHFFLDFLLFANGDAHGERRNLFARSFSLARVHAAQARMRAIASEIVDQLPRGEPFDFLTHMASRIPAEMMAALLGLPRGDAPFIAGRAHSLSRAVAPVYPIERHDEIDAAALDLFDYVRDALLRRFETSQDDMLSMLLRDWAVDRPVTLECLIHQIMGIMIGGFDTVRSSLAMLVALLLQHPDQWVMAKADPARIPDAVSETLRFEPPVGSILRFVREPVEIDGVLVPAGHYLCVSTLSALRDPTVCAHPDRFDICRTDRPLMHLVFGNGPHRCIGEMLARFELQEALAALIASAHDLSLIEPPRMLGFGGVRQITPMQVRLD
ncbi:cytochrome P450 [Hephaestia mangrovi]|uniref:cytochrome P450 n=1 Tax=Hephaestia mangrovi TaxID=2873268 RepID=UPI001CA7A890|nr:cytochrome P450 [Hephaestia mangrovi]MBY8828901.1 cytochrome P450 [Hephaestia mangrovi]